MQKPSFIHRQFMPVSLSLALLLAGMSGCGGGGGQTPIPGTVPSALMDQLAAQSAALKLDCPQPYLYYSSFDQGGGNVQAPAVAPTLTVANIAFTAMASTVPPLKLCVTSPTQDDVPAAVKALAPGYTLGWTHVDMVGNVDGLKDKKVFFGANYLASVDEARKAAETESVMAVLPDGFGGWVRQTLPSTRSYRSAEALPFTTLVDFEAAISGPGYYILYR